MNTVWHDFRYAARALLRSPGFTVVAVLTLAIGIGANTAIFSVVNAVLLKPLPLPEPDRLVRVYDGKTGAWGTASPPNFVDWQRDNSVFEDMGAYAQTAVALTGIGEAQRVAGSAVTAGFFSVLGTTPLLGRPISAAETEVGQERVVVLSHGLWRRNFGADPGILDRTVQLEGRDYTVIGVMPPGFEYPAGAGLWVPLAFSEEELATQRGAHYLDVIARLAAGVTVEQASTQMAAMARVLEQHTFEMGTSFDLGGPKAGGTVVGVASDIKHFGLGEESGPEVYVSHSQFPVDFMSMTVRTSVPPQSLVAPIREQVREMDSELPLDQTRTMEQRLADSIAQPRFYVLLLGIFAAAALALAAIGIYGVMTYSVRNRTNEIGVRRALGADASDVVGMVLTQAMKLAGGGLVLGLLAAFLLTRVLSGLLYGVSATDPVTFAGVAILLAAVALLASYIPARRATRVDPMIALREE